MDKPAEMTFSDKYSLGEKLGAGGFSEVFQCYGKDNKKSYAVKLTKRSAELTSEDEELVRNECAILKSMNHKHIVCLYDFFEDNDSFFTVIEYCQGGELFDRINLKEKYNEKEARDLVVYFLSALQYIHSKKIVHRDLKPENLLLTSRRDDADVKVVDFGFAKYCNEQKLKTQCGSPAYVAPELIKGEHYGTSVDMWAMGVVVFTLLGGYLPFDKPTQRRLFRQIVSGDYQFDPQHWDSVSVEAKDLIARLLQVDPNKRLTAETAWDHPWLKVHPEVLAARDLGSNLVTFKAFRKNARFRAAANKIIAVNAFRQSSLDGFDMSSLMADADDDQCEGEEKAKQAVGRTALPVGR